MNSRHRSTPTDEYHRSRLMEKVVKTENQNSCWGWSSSLKETGYGRIRIKNVEYIASRLSYAVHYGKDPENLDVMHSCNNPVCCNPAHLSLGTKSQNIQYAVESGSKVGGRGVSRNSGAKNPMSKLPDENVSEIIRLYAEGGILQREIAARFGVTQGYVSEVLSGAKRCC